MIFAAINWLSISINLLLVVFVIVCLLMALLILMQRPKQEGLGAAFGGGVTDQVFGARTTNVLQRGTVYLGSLFFIISITLAILISKQTKQKSLLEPEKVIAEESAEKVEEIKSPEDEKPTSLAAELSAEDTPTPTDDVPAPPVEEPAPTEETPAPPTEQPTEQPSPEENTVDKPE